MLLVERHFLEKVLSVVVIQEYYFSLEGMSEYMARSGEAFERKLHCGLVLRFQREMPDSFAADHIHGDHQPVVHALLVWIGGPLFLQAKAVTGVEGDPTGSQ